MSYCMKCGRQTDNADFICDECRAKQAAQPPAGGHAEQSAPPAQAGQGTQGAPANNAPAYNASAPGALYDPAKDRSLLPFNKCGLIGMIFSMAAFVFFFAMIAFAASAMLQTPGWLTDPMFEPTEEDLFRVGLAAIVPLFLSFGSAAAGVVLSAVGIARYRRFRAVGFAVAGLIIGAAMFLVLISMFIV